MSEEIEREEEAAEDTSIPKHGELLEYMQALGYLINKEGMCFGVAAMGLQAMRQGEKGLLRFRERLIAMQQIGLKGFQDKLAQCDPALRNDIFAFFDGIALFHQAKKYPELFGGVDLHSVSKRSDVKEKADAYPCYVYVQADTSAEEKNGAPAEKEGHLLFVTAAEEREGEEVPINAYSRERVEQMGDAPYRRLNAAEAAQFGNTLFHGVIPVEQDLHVAPLLQSVEMEREGSGFLVAADSFEGAYDSDALVEYFDLLAQHATHPVELLLGGAGHTIAVHYDPVQKAWTLIDANTLEVAGLPCTDSRAMAAAVCACFSDTDTTIFKTTVMQSPFSRDNYAAWKESMSHILTINGKNAAFSDSKGVSLLHMAVKDNCLEDVALLLEHGADVNKLEDRRGAPLHVASLHGRAEVARRLLQQQEIAVNQADYEGNTPLHLAAYKGNVEVMQSLLSREDIELNPMTEDEITPFYLAVMGGHLEAVVLLLERPDIAFHWADAEGTTPLHIAVQKGHIEIMALLLDVFEQAGMLPNTPDKEGMYPLHIAVQAGNREAAIVLLKGKADINQVNSQTGATPLLMAVEKGDIAMVQLLLEKHAAIDRPNAEDVTPLHIAASTGQVEVVQLIQTFSLIAALRSHLKSSPQFRHTPISIEEREVAVALLEGLEKKSSNTIDWNAMETVPKSPQFEKIYQAVHGLSESMQTMQMPPDVTGFAPVRS